MLVVGSTLVSQLEEGFIHLSAKPKPSPKLFVAMNWLWGFMNDYKFKDRLKTEDFEIFRGLFHRVSHLQFCRTAVEDYSIFESFSKLKTLSLTMCRFDPLVPDFSSLVKLKNLESFEFCGEVGNRFDFTEFDKMTNLKHANLYAPTQESLESLMLAPSLEELNLWYTVDYHVYDFSKLKTPQCKLKHLEVNTFKSIKETAWLLKFPQLEVLSLDGPILSDFRDLSTLTELRKAEIWSNVVSRDEFLQYSISFPNLLYFATEEWTAERNSPDTNWSFSKRPSERNKESRKQE